MPPTRLVGRERDLARIRALLQLEHVRLVTLSGMGGIGKTRLALGVATQVQDDLPDGVRFVDLAWCRDTGDVASAMSSALDLRNTGRRPPVEALKRALSRLHMLLVLDNFEQVLTAAPLIADLLAACPTLTILATSRAPLRLSWEREYPVQPLEVPDPALLGQPDALLACPSVALLMERIGEDAAGDHRELSDVQALAEICTRLGGIPLAIELAAARARLLPSRALLARLGRPLDLLTVGARDQPDRHQTLRQTFDWSYDLLPARDQALFRGLGTFVGGCSIEAAAVVISAGSTAVDVIDALGRLVESSLLRRERIGGDEGEPRLLLLEPVREYALERLDTGAEGVIARERHASFFLELAELAEPELRGPRQSYWLARLEKEHGNLQAALRWWLDHRDVERSLRLAAALSWFWWVRGYARVGRARLTEVLALQAPAPLSRSAASARARALAGAGVLAYQQADFEAAIAYTQSALGLFRELGDKHGVGLAFNTLGNCALTQADLSHAHELYERSLEQYRDLADERGMAQTITNLGLVALQRQDYPRAHALLSESLSMERSVGDPRGAALALGALGMVQCYQSNFAAAWTSLRESLSLWRDVGERAYLPLLLEACAVLTVAAGDGQRGLKLAAGASALRDEIESPRPPVWTPELERWLGLARRAVGEPVSSLIWSEGLALSAEAAIDNALSIQLDAGPANSSAAAGDREDLPVGLTTREAEVLRLVAGGGSNKEIASELVVSLATVERHLANIYAKIGARGRADATAFAFTHGLVAPPRDRPWLS